MEVLGVEREDLIEQYKEVVCDLVNVDDPYNALFEVYTEDELKDENGENFSVLSTKITDKPMNLQQVAEFLVDNVGKTNKIKINSI